LFNNTVSAQSATDQEPEESKEEEFVALNPAAALAMRKMRR